MIKPDFGEYYRHLIMKMLISYGDYAETECQDEAELDGYRAALHHMVDIFISDKREFNRLLTLYAIEQSEKHNES